MKRNSFFGIAFLVLMAMGIGIYLVACKKERVTPINNIGVGNEPVLSEEARTVVGKIKKFKTQLIDKENVVKSGLLMPADSVIWNVEALFNAEYTFPERKYLKTVKQELEFYLDVNGNGEAPFEAVANLYDEITEAVRFAYSDDGINYDKSLMAVAVEKGEVIGNQLKINVLVVSGQVKQQVGSHNPAQNPFGPDDCWYYGEYGGTCDDASIFCDAAEVIEDTINYYYCKMTVPQTGLRGLNYGLFMISLEGNEYVDENGVPYIYFYDIYGDPPLYLDDDLLNYYYNREVEVLMHLIPSDPRYQAFMPQNPAFVSVDIQGVMGFVSNGSYMHHKNYVIYASRILIPDTAIDHAKDLLMK